MSELSIANRASTPLVLPGPGLISILSDIVKPSGINIISPTWKPSLIRVSSVRLLKGLLEIAFCNLSLTSLILALPDKSDTMEPCISKLWPLDNLIRASLSKTPLFTLNTVPPTVIVPPKYVSREYTKSL